MKRERSRRESLARCETLAGFIREAWHVVEPGSKYVHGWHIDAICEHLEAITFGRFLEAGVENRLLINIPPGTMKSLIVSVFWPAWEWGPREMPEMRYLTTSYSEAYVIRDSRRMRDLVTSEWYRDLWPKVELIRTAERSFANTRTGFREGVPFASLTGGRGHRVIIDDPHSTETAESDADRDRAVRIFRESVPTRLVNPETSAIVVIMQRLHHEDVAGTAIKLGLGYQHLMLPMEFESDRRCSTVIDFEDPRTEEGELLFPERFPRSVIDRDKVPMGSYAVAGQFQQRPTPREGGMFKMAWFEGRILGAAPPGTRWVRHWDLAGSRGKRSARTAGVKLGRTPDGRFIVGHVALARDESRSVRGLIKTTAELDGTDVEVSLPQDPGQAGKAQKQDMIAMLAGFTARAEPETGDKVTRAEPFAAQCEAGNVYLVRGEWNDEYLGELCAFPGGSLKDQVDASSGAFARLARSGEVFTVPLEAIEMKPFQIPPSWPRAYAFEVGPEKTGAVWGAWDENTDTVYIYAEHIGDKQVPTIHATAIKSRGDWVRGVVEAGSHGRKVPDDEQMMATYRALGLRLSQVDGAGSSAIDEINQRIATNRLRIFSNLGALKAEYTLYRRDEAGRIVEGFDTLMNAMRGLVTAGKRVAKPQRSKSTSQTEAGPADSLAGY